MTAVSSGSARAAPAPPPRATRWLRALIAEGAEVEVLASGGSMGPILRHGVRAVVVRCDIPSLPRGEVIVFERAGGLVAHRFVRLDANGWLVTRGDAHRGDEGATRPEDVLGRVVRVQPLGPAPTPPVPPSASEKLARLATHALAEDALQEVVRELLAAGVVVAPVKGVALARWLYADPLERPLGDVDLLVSRDDFPIALRSIRRRWPLHYASRDLGEVTAVVGSVPVELHAEIGRRDLTRLRVADVLERSLPDEATFGVPVRRIDDLDHLVLLVANAVKDGYRHARPHLADDLERLVVAAGRDATSLIRRARAAGLVTALHAVAEWMVEERRSSAWATLALRLGPARRPGYLGAVRLARRRALDRRIALALACCANDDFASRAHAVGRLLARGGRKALGLPLP